VDSNSDLSALVDSVAAVSGVDGCDTSILRDPQQANNRTIYRQIPGLTIE